MFCLFTALAAEFGVIVAALTAGVLLLVFTGIALAAASNLKPPAEAKMLDGNPVIVQHAQNISSPDAACRVKSQAFADFMQRYGF